MTKAAVVTKTLAILLATLTLSSAQVGAGADVDTATNEAVRRDANKILLRQKLADASDALWKFALRTKRRYAYFQEQPRDHFHRGDGIGLTLP